MRHCFVDGRICSNVLCSGCILVKNKIKNKKGTNLLNLDFRVKICTEALDKRCISIVIDPLEFLCKKYNIKISKKTSQPHIILHYRYVSGPKYNPNQIMGVLIDDLPSAYLKNATMYKKFITDIKSYDFFVVPNLRLGNFLKSTAGENKHIIYYPGITGKNYYESRGLVFAKKANNKTKRMALINSAYDFDTRLFVHKDWELLYFAYQDKKIPNTHFYKITDVMSYYNILINYSPDIIVQDWIDLPGFYYKSNLKMRESILLNSCLVAKDKGNLYNIKNGVNGFVWKDLKEFHRLLDSTPVHTFREIGHSHKNNDEELLKKLYTDLLETYTRLHNR